MVLAYSGYFIIIFNIKCISFYILGYVYYGKDKGI